MGMVYANDDDMIAIADAIRFKTGSLETYKASQMPIVLAGLDVIKNDLASMLNGTITSYESDEVLSVKEYGFAYRRGLHTVALPNCTLLKSHAFYQCRYLKDVSLPNCVTLEESVFSGCEKLVSLELPKATSIGIWAFNMSVRFERLILGASTVCAIPDDSILNNTSIANGKGTIEVPANLVSAYKTATGWSTYASQIIAKQ